MVAVVTVDHSWLDYSQLFFLEQLHTQTALLKTGKTTLFISLKTLGTGLRMFHNVLTMT